MFESYSMWILTDLIKKSLGQVNYSTWFMTVAEIEVPKGIGELFNKTENPCRHFWELLRGSGYLGYVDSNQGYNPYKWVICPLTRVINLHITSY